MTTAEVGMAEAGETTHLMMHRGVSAVMAARGVTITGADGARMTRDIRSRMGVITVHEDDGRLHPMAMRIDDANATPAYFSTVGKAGARRTAIVLSGRLPSTVIVAAGGRLLRDVMTLKGLPTDLVVERVEELDAIGTVLVLENDDVPVPVKISA